MNYLPTWPIEITPLMVFGLMPILGSLAGYIAHKLSWLRSITVFMMIGFLMGPSGVGFLNRQELGDSRWASAWPGPESSHAADPAADPAGDKVNG